jgi:hypothetical protein
MEHRLGIDDDLRAQYKAAHERYLLERSQLGDVEEIDGISAGGMPTRVKCLHVLVGQSLVSGPGVNPFGDEALEAIGPWWGPINCAKNSLDDAEQEEAH